MCGGELLTCPCERQSEREPSSEGSVGGLALKSGRAVWLHIFFFLRAPARSSPTRGRLEFGGSGSPAVILTALLMRALSQPLRPGPWTAEFGALRPPHSGPVVSCQPAKPERPGASGSPGLGLAQPALRGPGSELWAQAGWLHGHCRRVRPRSSRDPVSIPLPAWTLPGGPRNPDFRNQDQDGSRRYSSES